ncbi:MAG TPA: FAD-binding oxidoreductase [Myxococcota bacterium]|nr:FAD-binding oxidoreductase [Myxococcota bacterium]
MTATHSSYRDVSFWFDSLPETVVPRAPLDGDAEFDVAIVGAGFSGLWTAYYLAKLRPGLRIAILEAEVAGYGASGRNGGWCVGLLAGIETLLHRDDRRAAGIALQREAFAAVDEVGRAASAEGIDCHYRKGGSVRIAATAAHVSLLRSRTEELAAVFGREDFRWIGPDECDAHVRLPGALGGLFTPHCAALHPARLARGLASCVERLGVRIFEATRVERFEPGLVRTARGSVRAALVVRATEAYTAELPGLRRALVPMHSWMIATEPLPEPVWKEIGLANAETFGDGRLVTTYGQRTADGRIAFGGMGSYYFGSRIQRHFPASHPFFAELEEILRSLLPPLRGARVTHRWGGALGVPRDTRPRVGLDRARGEGWIGGYFGEGVAASNLAGRTLAELIAGEDTVRTRLPLVAPPARPWEPEPLRSLAVKGALAVAAAEDRAAVAGRPPTWRARLFNAVAPR